MGSVCSYFNSRDRKFNSWRSRSIFYTYVLGDMKLMSGVSIIGLIASLVGIVMGPYLANRFGKKESLPDRGHNIDSA